MARGTWGLQLRRERRHTVIVMRRSRAGLCNPSEMRAVAVAQRCASVGRLVLTAANIWRLGAATAPGGYRRHTSSAGSGDEDELEAGTRTECTGPSPVGV